jgi:two-component system response regulator
VDDDPDAIVLLQKALQSAGMPVNLSAVQSGEEAMKFLRGKGRYADVSCPDLILLDLNMPGKDGREVLAEVKGEACLSSIPVIVMTTSDSEQDILTSYRLHANSYIVKPMNLGGMSKIVEAIHTFWINTAKSPARYRHEGDNCTCSCDRR